MKASDLPEAKTIADRYSVVQRMLETPAAEATVRRPGFHDERISSASPDFPPFAILANQRLEREAARLKRRAAQLGMTL